MVEHLIADHVPQCREWGVLVLGRKFHAQHVIGGTTVVFQWIRFSGKDFYIEYKEDHDLYKWFKAQMLAFNGVDVARNQWLVDAQPFTQEDYPPENVARVIEAGCSCAKRRHDMVRYSSASEDESEQEDSDDSNYGGDY